jgi:hypothetical protein
VHKRQRYANSNALDDDSQRAWNMLAQTVGYTVSERVSHLRTFAHRDAIPPVRMSMSRYAPHLDVLALSRPIQLVHAVRDPVEDRSVTAGKSCKPRPYDVFSAITVRHPAARTELIHYPHGGPPIV